MSKPDHDFLAGDACTNIPLRFVRRLVALLDLEGHFVRTAVLRASQGADGTRNRRVHI